MLRRTFAHLPGISLAKEKALWSRGIIDWADLRSEALNPRILPVIDASEEAYIAGDLHYFYRSLPRQLLWRMVPEFLEDVAYLDIETTGLGYPPKSHSTTITFYYRGQVYQEHEHHKKLLLITDMLKRSSMICTYFGEAFDVPFLQHEFEMKFEKAHIDLCFWLKRLGYKGGLKKVQKLFPEIPLRESLDIDGFDAVRLWRLHERGLPGALDTLLTYNAEDTVVLDPLLRIAYNLEAKAHPELELPHLPLKPFPELSTRIHPEVYRRLRSRADAEFIP